MLEERVSGQRVLRGWTMHLPRWYYGCCVDWWRCAEAVEEDEGAGTCGLGASAFGSER